MRHAKLSLLCLLCLCLIALMAGCGSTSSGGGGTTDPGSFTIGADSAVTIAQGQSSSITVTPSSANGFAGSVQVSVSGLPTGVTVSPATTTMKVGSSTTFTVTAAADAALGTTTVKVYGASGTLSTSTSVALTVTAGTGPSNADFALTATPGTLALIPGGSGEVTLSSTAIAGFSGAVAVAVNGLPTGVTVSPATISVTPGTPFVVTLTATSDASTTPTAVPVNFVGMSGALSHTATIQLTVSAVAPAGPDFAITATPDTVTVAQGAQSGEVQVAVTGSNGFSDDVAFTVSGLPTGVSVIPPSGTLQAGWMEPIVFVADANAPLGTTNVTLTGTSGALTHTATVALTVGTPPPADFIDVALSPTSETIAVGSVGTVTVTATATPGYAGTINLSPQNLPAGITATPATAVVSPGVPQTFTLLAGTTATPGTSTVTFLGQVNSVNGSADLSLTVVNPINNGLDVPTWHNDIARSGLNANETTLTPANVTSASFGKQSIVATDGAVDAQPLYLAGLTIGTQTRNVVFVATENDTVYALDGSSHITLWKTSALPQGGSETAADNQGCSELSSKVGITSTPVIDRNFGPDGAIYFVAKSKDGSGNYHQRLHALDLTTGAELSGSPVEITATYPANAGATNTFDPSIFVERAALLVQNGIVYLSWAAPCQQTSFNYGGWVMAYDEGTLTQLSVLDVTPNGSGGGIWMSGAGPAADAKGNVFLSTSTGTFDTTLDTNKQPSNGDYGNGYLRIQAPNGVLQVSDYFEPLNGVPGAANYQDQGSGGMALMQLSLTGIPGGVTIPVLIGAGKDGNIYLMSGSGTPLGEYDGTKDHNILTQTGALPNGVTSSPAVFNGTFYYGGSGDGLKAFSLSGAGTKLTSESANTLGAAGATPVISANGTNAAILWALDTRAQGGAVLYAYDATNLATELYDSTQAQSGARDTVGTTGKHAVPLVANGSVYIGTDAGVAIFGPLVP
ncbi:MAG: beta strand repeat-containing protein [Acidobacteriaceae bacterium]